MREKYFAGVKHGRIALLFILYMIVLIWVIIFKCNVNDQLHIDRNLAMSLWDRFTLNLIPFHDFYVSLIKGASLPHWLAFGFNIICCIPGGVLLGFFLDKAKGLWASFFFILGIEVFQLFSGFGGFDPTDIFLNMLGVIIGYAIYDLVYEKMQYTTINKLCVVFNILATPIAAFAIINTYNNFPIPL